MKFRLKKDDEGIELELMLKAVKAAEDYRQIRFMIKDGLVKVNNETEYARRRILLPGDEVSFKNKHYLISPHQDSLATLPSNRPDALPRDVRTKEDKSSPKQQKDRLSGSKDSRKDTEEEDHFIHHHKRPLQWTQKYKKNKDD